MERKVIETTDMTQTRNQACCSRRNDMTRKVGVSLAHRRKLCTIKKLHDNDIVDRARKDLKGY